MLGISFAAVFVRVALPAPPLVTGFYRMFFATLLAAGFLWLRPAGTRIGARAAALAAASGLCFGTDIALWHSSLVHTTVALSTLLVNVTPIHVGLFAVLVWHQKLERRFVAGTLVALIASALLLGDPAQGASDHWGAALALAASLFYAAYLLLMKVARSDAGAPALPSLVIMSAAATLAIGGYAWIAGDPFVGFPVRSWSAMLAAAVVSQLGGVMGILWALRWLPATLASVALLAQPVGTALLGWLLLGESLGWTQIASGVGVLAGIALAARGVHLDDATA